MTHTRATCEFSLRIKSKKNHKERKSLIQPTIEIHPTTKHIESTDLLQTLGKFVLHVNKNLTKILKSENGLQTQSFEMAIMDY